MNEKFQNDERRDESKKETQPSADSTLERLVEALTKIDATLNRLNERLEAFERRVDGETAERSKTWRQARRDLREFNEDDFDASSDWSDYPDAYKKEFDDVDDWEDVYDCAADVDEFSNGGGKGERRVDDWRDADDPYKEWAERYGRPKVGERDDEWVSPNELKAAENAPKIALEAGTYRVGTDLAPGRYLAKPREESAVVRVVCSQWRGVYTLERDDETTKRTKKARTFDIAMKLLAGATMRTDEPIELIYLSPIE